MRYAVTDCKKVVEELTGIRIVGMVNKNFSIKLKALVINLIIIVLNMNVVKAYVSR